MNLPSKGGPGRRAPSRDFRQRKSERAASRGRRSVLLAGLLVCVASVSLAAIYRTGPPPGYTGGFGEDTCHYCHYEFATESDSAVFCVAGFPERYVPGRTYTLEVSVSGDGLGAAGFQLAVRFATGEATGQNAGSLEPRDERTAVDANPKNGVAYARQRLEGVIPQAEGRATWHIDWTAPAAEGRVRLDAAANAGDGDESQMGDRVYTFTRQSTVTASSGGEQPGDTSRRRTTDAIRP